MLTLLVPGVLMGGSDAGGGGGDPQAGFLPIMGVGRAWWFLLSLLGLGASNG